MDKKYLEVSMFGGFRLDYNGNCIDDSGSRSKKSWLLLAYLLFYHKRVILQDELVKTMCDSDTDGDPWNAVKTLMHRLRSMLSGLGENAGKEIIIGASGGYSVNPDIEVKLDVEAFDAFISAASSAKTPEDRLENTLSALRLYKGDLLPKLSMESWTIPIEEYYHSSYINAAVYAAGELLGSGRFDDCISVCRAAVDVEPYNEQLCGILMKALIATDDRTGAIAVYDRLSKQLFSTFGIMPSEETAAIYREAGNNIQSSALLSGSLNEQLRETGHADGAFPCSYDIFKVLYRAEARRAERTGDVSHVIMFSVAGRDGQEVSRKSLDYAVSNFLEILRRNLRTGDIVSQCSSSQLIAMLIQANYENAITVCDRVIRAYCRKFPHSPVTVDFTVHPLEPFSSFLFEEE